jgi:preprotein translocase subunit SecE
MKKIFGKIFSYFKESKGELVKVVWPTRKQVLQITIAVSIISVVVGAILGLFDFILGRILSIYINLKL